MENLRREEKEVAEILIPCPFFFAISRLPGQRSNRFIQSSTIEFRSFSIRDNDGTREERQKRLIHEKNRCDFELCRRKNRNKNGGSFESLKIRVLLKKKKKKLE